MINQGPRNELAEKVTDLRARIADLRSRIGGNDESDKSTQTQSEPMVVEQKRKQDEYVAQARTRVDPAREAKAAELDALKAKLMGKKK